MKVFTVNRKKLMGAGAILAVFLLMALLAGPLERVGGKILTVMGGGERLRPIYAVDTKEKKIAISFDACWGAELTPSLLATLKKEDIKTTFFLVNIWIDDYPELVKTIVAAGHELGLHSTTHPDFVKLSAAEMKQELTDNYDAIAGVSGFKPVLFRPPFGSYNNTMIEVCQELNFHPIQWSIDSLDWKDLSAEEIYQRVVSKAEPGAIVLFHNNGKHTAEALPRIIAALRAEGYQIVPISELIYLEDYYVDHEGIQRQKKAVPQPDNS